MIFTTMIQNMLKHLQRFDTSSFELDRPFPKGKNKVIGLMKDELGR